MKKSTILIILVVFAVSVFIVGFLGIENVPYKEIIYVKEITPTHVYFGRQAEEAEIKPNKNGYYVNFPYEENITIVIDYEVAPNDATNRKIKIDIQNLNADSDATIEDSGAITLHNSGPVCITYRATDSASGPTMTFYLFPIVG